MIHLKLGQKRSALVNNIDITSFFFAFEMLEICRETEHFNEIRINVD